MDFRPAQRSVLGLADVSVAVKPDHVNYTYDGLGRRSHPTWDMAEGNIPLQGKRTFMLGYQTTYRNWLPLGGEEVARSNALMIACSRALLPAPVLCIAIAVALPRQYAHRFEGVILTIGLAYVIFVSIPMVWFSRRCRPLLRIYWNVTPEERPSFVCRTPDVLWGWLCVHRENDQKFQALKVARSADSDRPIPQ